METDEMELDTIGDRKTALFVIISDTDDTFNFVVSILYTQLFNLLCDKADDEYGGRLPVHVRCLLDEFANIGQIPKFEKLIATIRSRENLNSKHRKRVPTSVNPCPAADAPDGDFACWEVSQTLFLRRASPSKNFHKSLAEMRVYRSRLCSQKMQLMTLTQRKEVFIYGKFTGHRKGLSRRA